MAAFARHTLAPTDPASAPLSGVLERIVRRDRDGELDMRGEMRTRALWSVAAFVGKGG